eukprot:6407518-Prymnesium_polylepis.1
MWRAHVCSARPTLGRPSASRSLTRASAAAALRSASSAGVGAPLWYLRAGMATCECRRSPDSVH